MGCPRSLVVPDWCEESPTDHSHNGPKQGMDGHIMPTASFADQRWLALAHAIENELCRLTDEVGPEGMAKLSFTGRARGVRTVKLAAMPAHLRS